RTVEVADAVAALVREERPDIIVEHIGSTAVPGLPGKGIVDLAISTTPDELPGVVEVLMDLGFGPQPGPDPFPPTRPLLVGTMVRGDTTFRIHLHVQPEPTELRRDLAFRDALRADPELLEAYASLKTQIVDGGMTEGHQYTYQKQAWIADVQHRLGVDRVPIAPPATIGLLGGGQLGRMLALAARAMGYRIVVLDPDPDCPTGSLADRHIIASYDDVGAALRLAELSEVVTYELEHVALDVVKAVDAIVPVRPGRVPLTVTQDRIAERRFAEAAGAEVAPWREVHTTAELHTAAEALGLPIRLKSATGGYDGRNQLRLAAVGELDDAIERLGGHLEGRLLAEAEMAFEAELSVIVMRSVDGRIRTYPIARNVHDRGILAESVAPAPVSDETALRAAALGERLALAMGLTGTLTAELFLMPDGRLVVNELAPRVHNSGHWTLDGAATSQFEQHVRAICGLDLGDTTALAPTAMVNLWGSGALRDARLVPISVRRALSDPAAHLHLYDKRRVFERRKMGHVTVTAASVDEALDRARTARDQLRWVDDQEGDR
ncbi:MAG TPA: 5-(carboxyamino)imidazole ribonucleotide synthase, partial [Candidatus Limnocylindrales bacterium]|nr:5-(carboxyamino)imidazole ribonucleotide synthase [Candidatus Limnocylindrales bacterium]